MSQEQLPDPAALRRSIDGEASEPQDRQRILREFLSRRWRQSVDLEMAGRDRRIAADRPIVVLAKPPNVHPSSAFSRRQSALSPLQRAGESVFPTWQRPRDEAKQ